MKNTKIKIYIFSFFLLSSLFFSIKTFSQTEDPCNNPNDLYGYGCMNDSSLGNRDPRLIISTIINFSLGLIGTICVALIVYAGYLWMTAGGNDDQVGKAKNILIQAIIGSIIVLAAFSISTFVLKYVYKSTQNYGSTGIGVTGDGSLIRN